MTLRLAATMAALVCMAVAPPLTAQDVAPPTPLLRQPVRVCGGGDIALGTDLIPNWATTGARNLRARWGRSDHPDSLVTPLRPFFAGADILLLNVETAIGDGPAPSKCKDGATSCYAFRAPPRAAAALRSLGDSTAIVVGTVANNHARDAGPAGFTRTAALLRAADVAVTGADTLATVVRTSAGDSIAFLGFHTSAAAPDARDLRAVRRHVARAVAAHGTVIVAVHIGAEGAGVQRTRDTTEVFLGGSRGNPVAFARTVFEAGATAIFGHGPHVLRAGEWYGDQLVLYSLGNLLTYGPFSVVEPLNRGAVACMTIVGPRQVVEGELRATVQLASGVLVPDSTRRAYRLIDSLSALDFPRTGVTVSPTGVLGRRDRAGRDGVRQNTPNPKPPPRDP